MTKLDIHRKRHRLEFRLSDAEKRMLGEIHEHIDKIPLPLRPGFFWNGDSALTRANIARCAIRGMYGVIVGKDVDLALTFDISEWHRGAAYTSFIRRDEVRQNRDWVRADERDTRRKHEAPVGYTQPTSYAWMSEYLEILEAVGNMGGMEVYQVAAFINSLKRDGMLDHMHHMMQEDRHQDKITKRRFWRWCRKNVDFLSNKIPLKLGVPADPIQALIRGSNPIFLEICETNSINPCLKFFSSIQEAGSEGRTGGCFGFR